MGFVPKLRPPRATAEGPQGSGVPDCKDLKQCRGFIHEVCAAADVTLGDRYPPIPSSSG